MTANPYHLIAWAIMCGVFACAFHAILIAPNHIFSGPRRLMEDALMWLASRTNYGRAWRIACFVTKSIVDCEYCLAGQVAVAVYLYKGGRDMVDLSLFAGVALITGALLFKLFKHGKD